MDEAFFFIHSQTSLCMQEKDLGIGTDSWSCKLSNHVSDIGRFKCSHVMVHKTKKTDVQCFQTLRVGADEARESEYYPRD